MPRGAWLVAALACACGGGGASPPGPGGAGGGDGPPIDEGQAPSVSGTNPEDGALAVDPATEIEVLFSEPIDPFSVDASSVALELEGETVAGTLSVEGARVRFAPERELCLAARYTLCVTTAVLDLEGWPLEREVRAGFSVKDGAWSDPAPVPWEFAMGAVAIGGEHGAALRSSPPAPFSRLAVHRFDAASGWAPPELRFADDSVVHSDVAVDASGDVVVVASRWMGGSAYALWATTWDADSRTWDAPQSISDLDSAPSRPRVVFVAPRTALVVWRRTAGPGVLANTFGGAGGWLGPTLVAAGAGTLAELAGDGAGHALAAWTSADGEELWASSFDVATGWSPAEWIHTSLPCCASAPRLAMDPFGAALAVWVEGGAVLAKRFAGGEWSAPEPISAADGAPAESAQVGVSSSGGAIAWWGRGGALWASRFRPEEGWSAEQRFAADGAAESARLVLDACGNALALWVREASAGAPAKSLWSNRYAAGAGWAGAESLHAAPDLCAVAPRIAAGHGGRALAAWTTTVDCDLARGLGGFTAWFQE